MYLGQTRPRALAGTKEISKKKKKHFLSWKKLVPFLNLCLSSLGKGYSPLLGVILILSEVWEDTSKNTFML